MVETSVHEMAWQVHYRQRLVAAEVAAAAIKPGDDLYIPVAAQPRLVVKAMLDRGEALRDVRVTCMPAADYGWLDPEHAGRFSLNIVYANLITRDALARRVADYTPFMIYGAHKALDEGREEGRRLDAVIITVTPPNQHGYVSLGTSSDLRSSEQLITGEQRRLAAQPPAAEQAG